jgi:hypothetical protein
MDPLEVRNAKVMATLAQFAQALPNGTVNIMGGGLTAIPPKMPVIFIAGTVQFGWGAIGTPHTLRFELVDEQESAVTGENGDPIWVEAKVNVAPAPGLPFGTPMSVPLAFPLTPPELVPSTRYEFRLSVDGETHEDWNLGFVVMPEAQSKAA